MGISSEIIKSSLDELALHDKVLANLIQQFGYPEGRIRPTGYQSLLRTIVGQQVSVAAAASVWNKLENLLGENCPAENLITKDFEELRACGLSRQKQGYARSLAELILTGALDLDNLSPDDEQAISQLTSVKGIGRWSAEIYLLFAEGRPNIWPAGDLAIQEAVKRIKGLDERPNEKETRLHGDDWHPHRGAAATFCWHVYNKNFEAI
ncbi:DNA glycosylase [Sphingorhabdus lutea]|uniref:DNA-3-methyladenine glycosylase II n=1 Tax=Sphingorhabdus lutea TaxID=1913578 RepID=A0A1L3JB83_9SPHN|nr:DNA-3-methyladenine glycosylase [Sphingorhabdus lutea]APG62397.1 DNA glycosylase [Sphingorhabdus lutea]